MKIQNEKFNIQDREYSIPYHHLVDFKDFSNAWVMPWGQEYYSYVKKALDLSKKYNPKSVIDIGCGDGKVSLELAKLYGNKIKNVGVDLSERAIFLAKGLNWGNDAQFYCEPLSEIKDTFDMAFLIEVLEHIPDEEIEGFVNNVYLKLNKNGVLIVTVPSDCIRVNPKHYRHYNKQVLTKHLKNFKLIEIHYLVKPGVVFKVLNRLIRKFASINFLRTFFFNLYRLVCEKGSENKCSHLVAVFKK